MAKKVVTVMEESSAIPAPPVLKITPGKAPTVGGNFADMRGYLESVRDRYANVDIASLGIEEVLKVKKQFQTLRTTVDKLEKEIVKTYFNDPKKIIAGEFAVLYPIISQIEDKCDAAIEKEDQKRIDGINMVIAGYIKEFTADDPLEQKYLDCVDYKKAFYNKTQEEIDTRNDILSQVITLQKAQKADRANVRVIQNACSKEARLSLKLFLGMLARGDDVATVLEAIDDELRRLAEMDAEAKAPPVVYAEEDASGYTGTVVTGTIVEEAATIDYTSDLPERTKTITIEITYPVDAREALTKLFEMLHHRGIKSRVVG